MKIICFELYYVGFKNEENWRDFAKSGRKIHAIQSLREKNKRLSLLDAKNKVEKYIEKRRAHDKENN